MSRTTKKVRRSSKQTAAPAQVLYLYAISQIAEGAEGAAPAIAAEAIDGVAGVKAIRCEGYLCWVSRVSKTGFANQLNERMQDLEWLATAGLRHQRVVGELASHLTVLPARFGTVFLTEDSLAQHVKDRKRALRTAFERVADADEWGIKVFAVAKPKRTQVAKDASGADYLKRKAQLLRPRRDQRVAAEVKDLLAALTKVAVAASPGGKASAGQPNLLWHGSFLIRRKDRKKLDSVLSKYAKRWKDARRIDCSGPWPPYSFVGKHVQ